LEEDIASMNERDWAQLDLKLDRLDGNGLVAVVRFTAWAVAEPPFSGSPTIAPLNTQDL
jgi:hypothetical protein